MFIDESGLSERPHRVRTWAPWAQTPVPQYHFNWKLLSAATGIAWWNFYFRLYQGAFSAAQAIDFLGRPLRYLFGKLLVLWYGLLAHRAKVKYHWNHWKHRELPNFRLRDFAQLSRQTRRAAPYVLPSLANPEFLEAS